ncbi:MAG TPA: hypothetical protein VGP07_07260 [Polyangia bacterium]|jgi:hypothetical protein
MGQPRIIEIPYQQFLAILRHATDARKKIEVADKERWNSYIREHNVPEAGMAVKAKAGAMSGKTREVIVDGDGKADGYYIYSREDQFCLKYDLGLEE